MLKEEQDAMGRAMWDHLHDRPAFEIIERDDGFFDVTGGPQAYFAPYDQWRTHEREAMRFARGRVLDIGCGAGRHAIYLQEQGLDVLGIDVSPMAIQVAKARGLKRAEVMSVTALSSRLGTFDTLLALGNNFGLLASRARARWLLRRLARMTTDGGRFIAETRDVYKTHSPEHLEYHAFNRRRGRMSGQVRIRVRYKKYATPWFDYLMVSKEELRDLLSGTPWRVHRFLDSADTYIAVLERRGSGGA